MAAGQGAADAAPPDLPRLRLAAPPPLTAAPSAWSAAFEEASLLSPLGSSRSFSRKASPAGRQELLALEAVAAGSTGWAAAAKEARTWVLPRLIALPLG